MAASALRNQTVATSDASGVARFVLETPPPGSVWTGILSVPTAPGAAVFSVAIGSSSGGFPWGGWAGNGTFGPVQALPRETIVVTAAGLAPNTAYGCNLIGASEPESEAVLVYPTALATPSSSGAIPSGRLTTVAVATAVGAGLSYGPFTVASYQTLLVSGFQIAVDASNRGALLSFKFYADAALTQLVGTFQYDLRSQRTGAPAPVGGAPVLADAIPVIGPYVAITVVGSNSPVLNGGSVYASPNRFDGRAVFQNFYSTVNGVGALAAGASYSFQWSPMTPGPWQITAWAEAAAVPFSVECWEWYYNGGSNLLWVVESDGTPAGAFGVTADVAFSTSTPIITIRNDSLAAHDFSVLGVPLNSL